MTTRRKRSEFEIVKAILHTIGRRKNKKLTHILYGANLSHQMLLNYLKLCLKCNLIEISSTYYDSRRKKRTPMYSITTKGWGYLEDYERWHENFEKKYLEIIVTDGGEELARN